MSNTEAQTLNPRLGSLPKRMRILFIAARDGDGVWLNQALAADAATTVQLEETVGAELALGRLRDDVFDAVAIYHTPGVICALELTEAIRGLGVEEPILVLGDAEPGDFSALVYEIGGDAYVCPESTSTRTLLWTLSRACERYALIRENRRLAQCEKSRTRQEQDDAQRLLADQRSLVGRSCVLPEALKAHYCQLLRTQVIMGAGTLGQEIEALAQMLAGARLSADDALSLHLDALEELIRGLGNRSARHIMTRADLLALNLLAQLADDYRG